MPAEPGSGGMVPAPSSNCNRDFNERGAPLPALWRAGRRLGMVRAVSRKERAPLSIWGKIIGGAAGFALGGPIGAIAGVAAGHFVDRMAGGARGTRRIGASDTAAKQTAFSVALVVLAAKMAKADGHVTRDEIAAFKRIFPVPDAHAAAVGRIWDEARREAAGFEPYAQQIVSIFPTDTTMREELLGALFHIAMADGELHEAERDYLERVAQIFGFDEQGFTRVMSRHMGGGEADPYEVLGLKASASDDEIKKTYRQLIREHHPDKLIAKGLPEEMIDVANQEMAAINAAYDRIAKLRGIR
jgi:DnaJ like chaperone protein